MLLVEFKIYRFDWWWWCICVISCHHFRSSLCQSFRFLFHASFARIYYLFHGEYPILFSLPSIFFSFERSIATSIPIRLSMLTLSLLLTSSHRTMAPFFFHLLLLIFFFLSLYFLFTCSIVQMKCKPFSIWFYLFILHVYVIRYRVREPIHPFRFHFILMTFCFPPVSLSFHRNRDV